MVSLLFDIHGVTGNHLFYFRMKVWSLILGVAIISWWNKKPKWSRSESQWLANHDLGEYEELLRQHGKEIPTYIFRVPE